jgi:hypothetical protein
MSEIEKYDEIDVFMTSVDDKSSATKKSYKTQYNKLKRLLGNKDISESSQDKIIGVASDEEKPNSKQALINIGILVRRLYNLDVKKLEKERDKTKSSIVDYNKKKNEDIDLPTLNDLEEYTDWLFENNRWTDYIINYLLINYQVRNKDLNFKIVDKKRETKDKNFNYMWLDRAKVLFIRNDYKTAGTYGEKIDVIKDKDFITALRRVRACQKHGEECGTFIPNENQIGYYIKKATYKQIGEGAYFKVLTNAFKGNLQLLSKMGQSRGTDLNTIVTNYDIDLKDNDLD